MKGELCGIYRVGEFKGYTFYEFSLTLTLPLSNVYIDVLYF